MNFSNLPEMWLGAVILFVKDEIRTQFSLNSLFHAIL